MSNTHRLLFLSCLFLWACTPHSDSESAWTIHDPDLELELIAEQPDIRTPIGMVIDRMDALYVIESHTHTPPDDYQGPAYDRIKKGLDEDGDGLPDRWVIFADSIEDGMNLCFVNLELHLITKNQILALPDKDQDHRADLKRVVAEMTQPKDLYDHSALLGIAYGQDGWIYGSRGNVGGKLWKITAADGSSIEGYGDGGNVFRVRVDGSGIEEIATGFWNPFDLRFTAEGRLLLTDNDPDSRGPNRLIEIVPGGDYGYQSIYGGSGIHPYLAWNGELPGTLPFAAPLGEAPCALIDARFTHFGESYAQSVLVNIWEENNIVRIPLEERGSTVRGMPEVLVQGDSSFHPVGFATNSKGELFISDWVVRQYPNHGQGRIWRLKRKDDAPMQALKLSNPIHQELPNMTEEEMLEALLASNDLFVQSMLRRMLASQADPVFLNKMLQSASAHTRLQGILVGLQKENAIPAPMLRSLLLDEDAEVRTTALRYAGQQARMEVGPTIENMLSKGLVDAQMFETYLATLRHIQPDFVYPYRKRVEERSRTLPRVLPEGYLTELVQNISLSESIRALAVPYVKVENGDQSWLSEALADARETSFQIALIKALRQLPSSENLQQQWLTMALDENLSEEVRAQALLTLGYGAKSHCEVLEALELKNLPALAYLVDKHCEEANSPPQGESDTWAEAVNIEGNPRIGQLVFETTTSQCLTCHQVDGWGGTFGPNLSNIGQSKSPDQLVQAILNPSLEIAPEWQGWYVKDQEGKLHYGRQIDVHLNHVELMNAKGEFDDFPSPLSFGTSEKSLMPEGLHQTMTPEEFNHLIAYLTSL